MYRISVEREVSEEAKKLLKEFKEYLKINDISNLRVVNVYEINNAKENEKAEIINKIFKDRDSKVLEGLPEIKQGEKAFRIRYHKGGYNQREAATNDLIRIFLGYKDVCVNHSKIYIVDGVSSEEFQKIKAYHINEIESEEMAIDAEDKFTEKEPDYKVEYAKNFIKMTDDELKNLKSEIGLGMDFEDLKFTRDYFKKKNRDATIAELKTLDTYWSDHCRHTTFNTVLDNIEIEDGKYKEIFENAIKEYLKSRKYVYDKKEKPISLMDLATINAKEIAKKGLLDDKEKSEEVNACSIEIDVDVDGKDERWILFFKNETHNHPTEIEPFGGAATCLGGGIRDPLSGRSYVYQAMRITGAADPRAEFEETLKGKLPQRKITKTAMEGYSSYGNQIGATTGFVKEFYHPGFMAKRLELGALVAAAKKDTIQRGNPSKGDLVILLGGKTGRDGLGAAVGSSTVQDEKSLTTQGAEVQKGDPQLERKIIRLFRNPEATILIKRCNDFGAGGVAVAVGELADGLEINLDKVPTKYPGMKGEEIALSESQERMAVVIAKDDLEKFTKLSDDEDLDATVIAEVTDENRLHMTFRGETLVDIDREFLNTNGTTKNMNVVLNGNCNLDYLDSDPEYIENKDKKSEFIKNLKQLNTASQKGLVQRFDNTLGAGTVLSQLGGKNQLTPEEGMVAKIPTNGETKTCSIMTVGYDPYLSKMSQFHGGYYAVVESVAKVIALGGDYKKIRLSFQEFFESLKQDEKRWGKPLSSLLGAFSVMKSLDIPTLGGKDSMSGSFENIDVPPSLFSFAVTTEKVDNIISKEFKKSGSKVLLLELKKDEFGLLDLEELKKVYSEVKKLVDSGKILSAATIGFGGIAKSIAEMAFGNEIGFEFENTENIYKPLYGSLILEVEADEDLNSINSRLIGKTIEEKVIRSKYFEIALKELIAENTEVLNGVFPINDNKNDTEFLSFKSKEFKKSQKSIQKPKVLIPIFNGTHGEYDVEKNFIKAGAEVETFVFNTRNEEKVSESYKKLAKKIKDSNILVLAHGSIYGEEPEIGGKLIELVFSQAEVKNSLNEFLQNDGLILGIGAGLSGLLRLGLIENAPQIYRNDSESFISKFVDVKVVSNLSPWMCAMEVGDVYTVPIATYEGKIKNISEDFANSGQVFSQFVSENPTDSDYAVDGITSKDGKILGVVSSIDRMDSSIYKNVEIKGVNKIFESAVKYFRG